MSEKITHAKMFEKMEEVKNPYIARAEECAGFTIPSVFLDDSNELNSETINRSRVQGFGARLVRFLVGKFAVTILPPSVPFFKLQTSIDAKEKITEGDKKLDGKVESVISEYEMQITDEIDRLNFKSGLYSALRLAMITGDALLETMEDDSHRVYNMHNYCIKRDGSGKIMRLILREYKNVNTLDEEIRKQIDDEDIDKNNQVELYTQLEFMPEQDYELTQMIGKIDIGEPKRMKRLTEMFISIPWELNNGEDYGRGFVEENLGDFQLLEENLNLFYEAVAVSNVQIPLVNPNGLTKLKDFAKAKNGQPIAGRAQDITAYTANRAYEMQSLQTTITELKRDLSQAFLLGSTSVRNAERVTAQEVMLMSAELEQSFGGVYTNLGERIQKPLVLNAVDSLGLDMNTLDKKNGDLRLVITTGVEAINRSRELNKLNVLLQEFGGVAKISNPQEVAQRLNLDRVLQDIVTNSGLAGKGYLKDEDQVIEEQNQEKTDRMTSDIVGKADPNKLLGTMSGQETNPQGA